MTPGDLLVDKDDYEIEVVFISSIFFVIGVDDHKVFYLLLQDLTASVQSYPKDMFNKWAKDCTVKLNE